MAQLFVSHSSTDNALAARVKDALAVLGYESVFLDVDPTGGLVPGRAWRDQLFSNLDGCDAVVFLTTPASVASQWCHSELALTRWLRKPILALLVDGADPHPLTEDLQGLKITSDHLDPERLRSALVTLGLDREARWDPSRSPYPGLRAFDESYAAVFFGRDRQVDQLRQLVDPPSRSREGAIVPVLGPSGSGKSSLVRAGLVPALRLSPEWVISDPWTPSDAPLAEMSLALAHAAKQHSSGSVEGLDADRCAELLRTPGGIGEYARRLRGAGGMDASTKILVVVDQAEELVTITSAAERRAFLEALTTSCVAPSPLRVVMTARTDMWDRVAAETAPFAMSVAPTVLHVPPLSRADLAEVVREPARRAHLTLEDGLVERLVDDTGSGEALPLLAFTLARMAADAAQGRLTQASYDAIGGVRGAIASRAAEVAHGGRTEAEVAEALLHLVSLDEVAPHKRLARAGDVPAAHREILDDLVDARLVVVSEVNDQQVYAPAHEALLSAWSPLVHLIESRREDLLLRARLERRAADWRDAGATASGLLAGLELDQARDWRSRNTDLAAPDVVAYVDASAQRERRGRIIRTAVGAVVAVLVAALVVTLLVNSRSSHRLADSNRRLAVSARVGELAAVAQTNLVQDPAAAAIALLEGMRLDPGMRRLQSLARTLLTSPARNVITTDGATLASGGDVAVTTADADITVWDLRTGRRTGSFPAGSLTIRPDGRVIVRSTGTALETYDLGAGKPQRLTSFGSGAGLLAFSPNGALLASVNGSGVTVWDLRNPSAPEPVATWHDTGPTPGSTTILDDGTVLVADSQHALTAWAALGDGSVRVLDASKPDITPAVISTDDTGSRALLGGPAVLDGDPVVDLATGRVLNGYRATDSSTKGLAAAISATWTGTLSHGGDLAAVFDLSGRGYVFSTADGSLVTSLVGGHTALVNRAQFTTAGLVATAGLDGTLRLWDPKASSTTVRGAPAAALCRTFGGWMDQDSWRTAMGSRRFVSPCPGADRTTTPAPLRVAGDIGRPPTPARSDQAVFRDDFSGPRTDFGLGRTALSSGRLHRTLRGGSYRMTTSGLPEDYQFWSLVDPGELSPTWSVTTEPAPGTAPDAACGVTAGFGATQVTATVDRASGSGQVTVFAGGHQSFRSGFSVDPGSTEALTLRGDHGLLAVYLGDRSVAAVTDSAARGTPTSAGVVGVGNTTCAFDTVSVGAG